MSKFMYPDALVSTEWLAAHANDRDVIVFECTTYLDYLPTGSGRAYDVRSGRADYDEMHIAGAAFLDVQEELSDTNAPAHLRFKCLPAYALGEAFAQRGVADGKRVVLYTRGSPQWATRVWWLLRYVGFDNASVLDGGYEKWSREGRPCDALATHFEPGVLSVSPRPRLFVTKDEMLSAINDSTVCSINALGPELHTGEVARYGRPGHIPGSANVPAASLLDENTNTVLPPDAVAQVFAAAGAHREKRTLLYCGGGIAATFDAFLLHQLGFGDLAVYDASMSEWARDDALPMETGLAPQDLDGTSQ